MGLVSGEFGDGDLVSPGLEGSSIEVVCCEVNWSLNACYCEPTSLINRFTWLFGLQGEGCKGG